MTRTAWAASLLVATLITAGCSRNSTSESTSATIGGTTATAPTVNSSTADTAETADTVEFDAGATESSTSVTPAPASAEGDATVPIGSLPVAAVKKPVWGKCSNPQAAAINLSCAKIIMPIDHAQPNGETFTLMVSKLAATGKRRGSMLVNPGGPGASGLTYASSVANRMPKAVREAYDFIGFDPRGTGESMAVDCVPDSFLDAAAEIDPTPDDDAELAVIKQTDLETECRSKYPDLERFSTVRVAQDMDALRAALGDTKLTYYGVSYGSYLGAVYATAFPDRVGAMVLDGAFLPESTGNQSTIVQWGGFNKAFANWSAWCEREVTCPFNRPDVTARYLKLIDALDAKPLKVGTRTVGEGVASIATVSSLYAKLTWPIFAAALSQAEAGDGAGLLALADAYNQRDPKDGTYAPLSEANMVISCASGIAQPVEGDIDLFTKQVIELGDLGRFVSNADWGTNCDADQPTVSYTGSVPLVVIGGENDPATPYSQALTLTAALGQQASLITFTGEGHGGLFESTCAKEAVETYYLKGTRPEKGLTCAQAPVAKPTAALAAVALGSAFTEVPMEEGAALLGLDASGFASRTFRYTGTGEASSDALISALMKQGYTSLYSDSIPDLPDSLVGGLQKDTEFIIFGAFGPAGMNTSDLLSIAPLAGPNNSLVILTTPVTAEALKSLAG